MKWFLFALLGFIVLLGVAAWMQAREEPPALPLSDETWVPVASSQRSLRAGVSAVRGRSIPMADTGIGWYFNWTAEPAEDVDLEFSPMVCAYPDGVPFETAFSQLEERLSADPYPPGTLFIVGNELGYTPQHDSREPDEAARNIHACAKRIRMADPSYRVALGPVILSRDPQILSQHVGGAGGLAYLERLLDAHRKTFGEPLDVDFFSATSHVLEGSGLDTEAFRKQIRTLRTWLADRGLRDHGLLITEMGAAFGQHTPNEVGVFLEETVDFVMHARDPEIGLASDENRLVQRFAWFTAHPLPLGEKFQLLGLGALYVDFSQTALFTSAGQLTRLGQRYARQIQRRPAARPSPNPPPI